jgi:hypothetical protein
MMTKPGNMSRSFMARTGGRVHERSIISHKGQANHSHPAQGNRTGHTILQVGTLLGRILYPIWAIAVGFKLIRAGTRNE